MSSSDQSTPAMTPYDHARWEDLKDYWAKQSRPRKQMPPQARAVFDKTGEATKRGAAKAGRAVSERAPQRMKQAADSVLDSALLPTVDNIIKLLELLNDWVAELSDPETVIKYHQKKGRDVTTLADLKTLDLKELDEVNRRMALHWRTFGAGQGAAFGALAMIPVPVLGSMAAISLDMIAMQALSGAIATRVCYAYGFDPDTSAMRPVADRMAARSYLKQLPKAGAVNKASVAFEASRGRVNWSAKLRQDHRLMAAVENLMKRGGRRGHVPVKNARMGMPLISVVAGAATNAYALGDIAQQANHFAATLFLAEKYGLELPPSLRHTLDEDTSLDPHSLDIALD